MESAPRLGGDTHLRRKISALIGYGSREVQKLNHA